MMGSYLTRLGLTMAGSLRRGRSLLLDEVRMPMRVWPTDVDIYGHLNNGRYLTLMDQGRLDHGIRCRWVTTAIQNRWKPIAGGATIRFKRELRLGAKFELVTRLAYWDARAFYIEQRFEQGGRTSAQAYVRIVFKKGGRTVTPAEIVAALKHRDGPPAPSDELLGWIRTQAPLSADKSSAT